MRLLAYGGTRYVERRRIGEWPEIPEGALSDTYGLPAGVRSYGVGLLGEGDPFLIIRERQNLDNRGGYAFTLLLDPGRDVWEQVGWNGARLLIGLCDEQGKAGQKLLENPEAFTVQEIDRLLRGLRPAPAPSCRQDTETIGALWAGSAVGPPLVVFSPHDIGYDERPPLECVAEALDALPLPFRCGFGWLIGGSEQHGRAFGARLTLDEDAAPGGAEVRTCIEKGRTILSDWKIIVHHEVTANYVGERAGTPVWQWRLTRYKSLNDLLRNFGVLARTYLAKTPEERDAIISDIDGIPYEEDPLLERLHERAFEVSVSGSETRTPLQTRHALKRHLDGKKELKPGDVERLDAQTLDEELVGRNLSPSFVVTHLSLDWETRWRIWHRLLTEVEKAETMPARLKEAIDDLNEGRVEGKRAAQTRILAEAAVERTAKQNKLLVWLDARYDPALAPWVGAHLRAVAERQVKEREGDSWPLEYLAFSQDVNGSRLAASELKGEGAAALVLSLLTAAREGGPLSSEASAWLTQLAGSPLRSNIPLQAKYEVAKASLDGWHWFYVLWQLYHGQRGETEEPVEKPPPEDERARLRLELHELIVPDPTTTSRPILSGVPNLKGLFNLLGHIPAACIEALATREPSLNTKTGRGWLEGWRALGREDVYQSELLRFVVIAHDPLTTAWFPLEQISEKGLRELVGHLLSGGKVENDSKHRARLLELFGKWPQVERLTSALNHAFENAGHDEEKIATFVRRYAGHEGATRTLFPRLEQENQRRWVALMAARNQKFVDEVHKLYVRVVESEEHTLGPYERAVLEFMCTAEGHEVKRKVARWYYSILAAGDIDEQLKLLLGPVSETEPAVASSGKFMSWLKSFFRDDESETAEDAERATEAEESGTTALPDEREQASASTDDVEDARPHSSLSSSETTDVSETTASEKHLGAHTSGDAPATSRPGSALSPELMKEYAENLTRRSTQGEQTKDDSS